MNAKKTIRIVLDVALTAMLVAEMFIQFTGVFLHEVIGFAFFATIVVHLALSAKWIRSTAGSAKKGTMTARRTALAIIGILLAVNVVVLGISSVAISTILESAGFTWALGSYATWATVHAASAYTFCALVLVHLGMHWAFLASAFRVPYDPSRRRAISSGVHAAAAVGALALGVMAVNQIAPLGSGNGNSGTTSADAGTDAAAQASGNSGFASPSDAAGDADNTSASSGSSSGSSQNGKGKGKTKGSSTPSSGPAATPSSSSPTSASTESSTSSGTASSPSQGSSGAASSDDSSSVSGICTLCRKQCPLSNPKCDKPYRAGLL